MCKMKSISVLCDCPSPDLAELCVKHQHGVGNTSTASSILALAGHDAQKAIRLLLNSMLILNSKHTQ